MSAPDRDLREAEVESEEGSCHNPMPDNDMNLRRSAGWSIVSHDIGFKDEFRDEGDQVEVDDISFDIDPRARPSEEQQLQFANLVSESLAGHARNDTSRFPAKSMPVSKSASEELGSIDMSFDRQQRGTVAPN